LSVASYVSPTFMSFSVYFGSYLSDQGFSCLQ
jgi:hypothetical protein